jgi:hypothetical protein
VLLERDCASLARFRVGALHFQIRFGAWNFLVSSNKFPIEKMFGIFLVSSFFFLISSSCAAFHKLFKKQILGIPTGPVSDLCKVISDATLCPQFLVACKEELSKNTFPPALINFWFVRAKSTESDYGTFFRKYALKGLSSTTAIKYPNFPTPKAPETLKKNTLPNFKQAKQAAFEPGDEKIAFLDKASMFPMELNPQLVALFLHFGFDAEDFCGSKTFSLWMHGQPKGNNRAIRLPELWSPNDNENPGFIDFYSNHKETNKYHHKSVVGQHMVLIPYKVCSGSLESNIEDTSGDKKLGDFGYLTSMLDCPSNSLVQACNTFNGSFVDGHFAIAPSLRGLISIWELLTVGFPCSFL